MNSRAAMQPTITVRAKTAGRRSGAWLLLALLSFAPPALPAQENIRVLP